MEAVRADRLVGSAGVFLIGGIVNCQYVSGQVRGGWRREAEGCLLYVAVEMTPSDALSPSERYRTNEIQILI
jgi:hypothetical protein